MRYRILSLLLLAACLHPTQSAIAAPPPRVQTIHARADSTDRAHWPVIVAFGDSLTAGYGADSGKSYPDYLERDLIHDGYHYRVINLGVSGNTSKDGLARVKDVVAAHPVLVIVGLGGNDGLRGVPVPEMRANLEQILSAIAQSHIPIVLGGITLPPNYGAVYVTQFNAVYPALAKRYHCQLLPFMLDGVWNHSELMQQDGIHPTAPGYEIVAGKFVPLVEPMLRKSR